MRVGFAADAAYGYIGNRKNKFKRTDSWEIFTMLTQSGRDVCDELIPDHPLLHGKVEIGRGESCVVFDKGDGEAVYKVVMCSASYAFYTDPERPDGRHYPRLIADHGVLGIAKNGYPMHLLEMEKLYPIPADSEAAALAASITTAYIQACRTWTVFAGDMGSLALFSLCKTPLGLSEDMQDALQRLNRFTEDFQVLPDLLNKDNLMVRKDGTLVFSDPVFLG